MTVPFRIREAEREDNDRLIELARRCPIRGNLKVYLDRYPDFFAMTRQQGERSTVYVAESLQGDLVACAVFIERSEQWNGQSIKVLHFGDLRIDPSVRRTRIAAKLVEIYNDLLRSGRYHHAVVEILKSNTSPGRANSLLRDDVEIRNESDVTVYKLLPLWKYRPSKEWSYRAATQADLPQLSRLLQTVYKDVMGAPSFSIEWLQEATQKHASFTLSHILVAEKSKGEIVACLAQWDQAPLRKTVVMRFSRAIKVLLRFLALLNLLWKLPPLPREGRSLQFKYLRWLGATPENIPALRSLLRFALEKTRLDGKYQFVMVGFHQHDRLKESIRGLFKTREPMHIYSHRLKTQNLPAPSQQCPLYVDLSLI